MRHSRLLQHDLGQPYAIGVAVAAPPRQVAAVRVVPVQQAGP